jgi:general secretion pathway protein F
MAVFKYIALSDRGQKVSGVLDADTAQEAREILRARRVHVRRLDRVEAETKTGKGLAFLGRRKAQDVVVLTRELATLLRAGIELVAALTVLLDEIENKKTEVVYRDLRDSVSQGKSFAEALGRHPKYFDGLYVKMVGVGEASGKLGDTLDTLATFMEQKHENSAKLVAALTYPLVTSCFGVTVVIYLLTSFVPKIRMVLTEQGRPLPAPTKLLIGISDFVSGWWWLIAGILVLAALAFTRALKGQSFRYAWHKFILRVPVMGVLVRKHAVMRFALTFSVLLKSGLQVLDALRIAKDLTGNLVLIRTLDRVEQGIREGTDISAPLKESHVFPASVGHLIAVGERTGRLEDMLDRITDSYSKEIEVTQRKMLALMEPALILCLAVVVAFIMLAIIMPIVDVSTLYKH